MAAALARRAAATIPRHLAAAAPTISPAAAARSPLTGAFLRRRRHHTSASPHIDQRIAELEKRVGSLEAGASKGIPRLEGSHPVRQLEERVARLEVDSRNQTARLFVEIENKMVTLELKMDKASFEQYKELQVGHTTIQGRCGTLSDQIRALAVASAARDVKADKQHVQCLLQVKKNTWKVACTVLLGASTVAFGVMSIVSSHSRDDNLKAADDLFQKKIAELEKDFNAKLHSTVKQAVELVLAKRALEESSARDQPPPGTGGTSSGGSGGSP